MKFPPRLKHHIRDTTDRHPRPIPRDITSQQCSRVTVREGTGHRLRPVHALPRRVTWREPCQDPPRAIPVVRPGSHSTSSMNLPRPSYPRPLRELPPAASHHIFSPPLQRIRATRTSPGWHYRRLRFPALRICRRSHLIQQPPAPLRDLWTSAYRPCQRKTHWKPQ